ncbi:hypothetical protein [Streptomyces sp. NPDC002851]
MPTAREIADTVWNTDGVVGVPGDWPPGNDHLMAKSIVVDIGKRVRGLEAKLSAQAATIDKLVDAVGTGPGADLEVLKAEIRAAFESVSVRLDVQEG